LEAVGKKLINEYTSDPHHRLVASAFAMPLAEKTSGNAFFELKVAIAEGVER